jgi:uncharacterized protein YfiM (DUF2279 family)
VRGVTRTGRALVFACGVPALGGLLVPVVGFGAPAGAASTSSLSKYLLKSNEIPGYAVGGRPTTTSTAAGMMEGESLTTKQSRSAINTLQQAGFVKAVQESMKGSNANEGLSTVMQFSSPAGAQAGAALFLHLAKTGQAGSKPFTVPGVPGAKGVTVTGAEGGSANAYWSVGDCAFGSGIYNATALSAKAVASAVGIGIKSQVKRVGATCP